MKLFELKAGRSGFMVDYLIESNMGLYDGAALQIIRNVRSCFQTNNIILLFATEK